ncbi:aryl-alcohol-oxidase from pleurotus Eryingii [Trametopsis cervina]|nr:aryl-alcohol-oxidase from pleurotus Eryingii [Trametopsis cervina]
MLTFARLAAYLALVSSASAAILTDPSQLKSSSYDYVIVGGGTAGLVLANRLSENPKTTVLVLEAGGTGIGNVGIEIPLLTTSIAPGTDVDWGFKTVPQPEFNNRELPYMRGKVLGGSSSINYMIWNRGTRADHDNFAAITQSPDLKWDNMLKYFAKVEKAVPPTDNHNTSAQWDISIHSKTGMVEISLPGFVMVPDLRAINTTAELPNDFPYVRDLNSGSSVGFGWNQASIGHDGARHSSFVSYLQPPQFQNRPNLSVLVTTRASRVVPKGHVNGQVSFTGGTVEYIFNGTRKGSAVAKKEILLSAGVFNTPQLLQLSGIGDNGLLSKLHIPTLVNLPSVGLNFSDHPLLQHDYIVNTNLTIPAFVSSDVIDENIQTWNTTHQGPLTDTIVNTLGFLRFPPNSSIFKTFKDPSPGPTAGHWELIIGNGEFNPGTPPIDPPVPNGNYMAINTQIMAATSRGTVTINTTDPLALPVLDLKLMTTDWDKAAMREAVRASLKFTSAKAWSDYVLQPYGNFAKVAQDPSDANIDEYVAERCGTIWHGVGTAAMSPKGATWGVVDPDHRVKHTLGLRVVDASVFPVVPTMHTQGPTYAYAERAADLIKAGL